MESEYVDENKYIPMEISVDPMMVLQNSEESNSPESEDAESIEEDVIYLHGVDGEDVTIKLIKKGDTSDEKTISTDIIKPFPCHSCNRSFFTELALKNHSWTHFNEDKTVKPFKCSSCREQFDYKNDLMIHLKNHRSNIMCQVCGRM